MNTPVLTRVSLDVKSKTNGTRPSGVSWQVEQIPLEDGFRLEAAPERAYEVRGISRTPAHMRCAVRAKRGARVHIDSLDLYSARARQTLARACADLFEVGDDEIVQDLARLIEYAEGWQKPTAGEAARVELSDMERAEALKVLCAPDLIDRLAGDLAVVGMVGEAENLLLGYLAGLSRKLDEPLSIMILSRSSAGKSRLADTITRFVPEEELRRYTRVTGQALFYTSEEGLRHKLVAIEEAVGAQEAGYSIRTLQSAGELRVAVTTKDPRDGRMRTEEYTVKGPVAFVVSSTSSAIDSETQSRFVVLTVDESQEATSRILAAQRLAHTARGLEQRHQAEAIIKLHQSMQRLIEPVLVVIPFADRLRFPDHTLRARRDQKKYLTLIQAVALLHQHQRERKTMHVGSQKVEYIEATVEDVLCANRLAAPAFARTLDEISPQGRALLGQVRVLCEEQAQGLVRPSYTFRRRDLRQRSGWSETQLRQYLGELVDHELCEPVAGKQGKEYVYHLAYDEQGRCLKLDLATEQELRG
jgi:hypothetical protein